MRDHQHLPAFEATIRFRSPVFQACHRDELKIGVDFFKRKSALEMSVNVEHANIVKWNNLSAS